MKSPKYSLVILVTMVMLDGSCRSSFAFNIKGQTSAQSIETQVNIPGTNINGIVTVSTKKINEIRRGGTEGFLKLLRKNPQGWQFERGGNLKGDFNIQTYYPCGPATGCGAEVAQNYSRYFPSLPWYGKTNGIGASISVDYERTRDDVTNPYNNLAWIQRAMVNTGDQEVIFMPVGERGRSFDVIDSPPNRLFYPGADYVGRTNPQTGQSSYSFFDVPYNLEQDPQPSYVYNNNWSFELYLVELVSPNKFKIHNGISWGWTSEFTPTPTPKPCSGASGGGGCVTPSPSPSPIPVNSVRPVPTPRPTPRPTPSPSPSPRPRRRPSPRPTLRRPPAPTRRRAPAPTRRRVPAPTLRRAPAPRPAGRPIRAVPSSWIPNANAAKLPKSSLFESSSKANTDYLTAISSALLEDPELSSTDNSLNNANLAGVSRDLLENPELSSTDSNENPVNLAGISSDLLENSELSSTDKDENNADIGGISADLLEDPELSSTDSDENNADLADISADLLEDPELSSEDHNSEQVDLAGISSDLLEDPELSYLDDTLTAQTQKVSSKNTDDDPLSAEPVPEPTTALGTLFALAILPIIKRLKNRKNKE